MDAHAADLDPPVTEHSPANPPEPKKLSRRPVGAGRQKGQRNRITNVMIADAVEAMRKEGCNPIAILAQAALGKVKSKLRVQAAAILIGYAYPKKASIEVTPGNGGGSTHSPEAGRAALNSLIRRLTAREPNAGVAVELDGKSMHGTIT